MAATTLPPKAGFHATSRPPSMVSSTASPTSPAPRRPAARAATSRPHIVPAARTAHGAGGPAPAGEPGRDIRLDRRAFQMHELVGPASPELVGVELTPVRSERHDAAAELCCQHRRRTQQFPGHPRAPGLDQHADRGAFAAGPAVGHGRQRVVPRRPRREHPSRSEHLDRLARPAAPRVPRAVRPAGCRHRSAARRRRSGSRAAPTARGRGRRQTPARAGLRPQRRDLRAPPWTARTTARHRTAAPAARCAPRSGDRPARRWPTPYGRRSPAP